jgi:hypothetical protein
MAKLVRSSSTAMITGRSMSPCRGYRCVLVTRFPHCGRNNPLTRERVPARRWLHGVILRLSSTSSPVRVRMRRAPLATSQMTIACRRPSDDAAEDAVTTTWSSRPGGVQMKGGRRRRKDRPLAASCRRAARAREARRSGGAVLRARPAGCPCRRPSRITVARAMPAARAACSMHRGRCRRLQGARRHTSQLRLCASASSLAPPRRWGSRALPVPAMTSGDATFPVPAAGMPPPRSAAPMSRCSADVRSCCNVHYGQRRRSLRIGVMDATELSFFATCPKGMEELLADELRALGAGLAPSAGVLRRSARPRLLRARCGRAWRAASFCP